MEHHSIEAFTENLPAPQCMIYWRNRPPRKISFLGCPRYVGAKNCSNLYAQTLIAYSLLKKTN